MEVYLNGETDGQWDWKKGLGYNPFFPPAIHRNVVTCPFLMYVKCLYTCLQLFPTLHWKMKNLVKRLKHCNLYSWVNKKKIRMQLFMNPFYLRQPDWKNFTSVHLLTITLDWIHCPRSQTLNIYYTLKCEQEEEDWALVFPTKRHTSLAKIEN